MTTPRRLLGALGIAAVFAIASAPVLAADGDAANGANVFKKCIACHKVGDGAKNGVGPQLNGIIGRTTGTAEGYKYSPLNHAAGEQGLVWSEEFIVEYLADPKAFLYKYLESKGKKDLATGATKMVFKLPDEQQRKDVAAYLKSLAKP